MKKNLFLIFLLLIETSFISLAQQLDERPVFYEGRVYFKLKDNVALLPDYQCCDKTNDYPLLGNLLSDYNVQKIYRPFKVLENTYQMDFDTSVDANLVIRQLSQNAAIEYAERIPIEHTLLTPNDLGANSTSNSGQWALHKINAPAAWDISTGSGSVVVAVVDDGVLMNHEDLVNKLWVNTDEIANNNIDDDNDGYIDNINGWDVANNDNNTSPPATLMTSVPFWLNSRI